MTEAELTEQLLAVNEQVYFAISVSFTVISAYILGLYWFLHKSSWLLKLEAFFLFTLVLVLLGMASFGLSRHSQGIILSLEALSQTTELSILGKMSLEQMARGVSMMLTKGSFFVGGFIYIGLAYLTFFYNWKSE